MIQIILDSTETPTHVVYSQHFSGERASWGDVEKVNQINPVIYVALGSHAGYFKPYQGKLGLEGDTVGSAEEIPWENLHIIVLGEMGSGNHPADQNWLEYGGRWGNWAKLADVARGAAGPSGPGHGENENKWVDPLSWGSDFFLVNQNWFMMSWVAYYFLYIFSGIITTLVAIKIWRVVRRQRQGRLNLMKILRSKAGVGVVLGIVGVVIYFAALFLPWYVVRGTIQTTVGLQTIGEQDLVLIDGVNGLQVNTLQSDQGFAQLFGLGVPLGIILLSSVVLNFLDLVGVDKPKTLSRTFLMSGITSLIPVIVILVFIIQLATLIPSFAGAMGGEAVPPQVEEMAQRISASPFTGQYSSTLDAYGSLKIWWSLGIGSYLFIAAAAVKLAAGIVIRTFGKGVIPEKVEEAKKPPEAEKPEELPPPQPPPPPPPPNET